MIPNFPLQKVSLLYNQTRERVLRVISLVFLIFKTFRKLRKYSDSTNSIPVQGMTAAGDTKLTEENIFWEVKNNFNLFFWKFKEPNFSSRNRKSCSVLSIVIAPREFPWSYLGGETEFVLSWALKNRFRISELNYMLISASQFILCYFTVFLFVCVSLREPHEKQMSGE